MRRRKAPSQNATSALFDALFAERRHYRGDLRLIRTAIRRGWMADSPQADRDALVARFDQATAERRAGESKPTNTRAGLGECWVTIELDRANLSAMRRAIAFAFDPASDEANTGRPREKWRVSDFRQRIDANEIRRRVKAQGADWRMLHEIELSAPASGAERIGVIVAPAAIYGWRLSLVCPRCDSRRLHLYPTAMGVACRRCALVAP